MHRLFFILLAMVAAPLPALAAGFERTAVPGSPDIDIGIWYPTATPAPAEANTPFRQALALDAPLEGTGLPLIVVSHGDGGWMGGHAHSALALAEAGYVVVAPEHPGNNSEDESATPGEWLVSRPADVTAVLDFMLSNWSGADRLDPGHVGVFGFSAGGYTGLVAAGATPDFAVAARHCADRPDEFVCRIGLLDGLEETTTRQIAAVAGDPRIGAVSVAAPGFGFAFDHAGLQAVTIPVQIWSGSVDDRVPHQTNGLHIAQSLPGGADTHVVADAGHFAFMAPCNPRLEEINPRIWDMVCVDADGFDRAAFHRSFNDTLIAFFDAALDR